MHENFVFDYKIIFVQINDLVLIKPFENSFLSLIMYNKTNF